MENPNQSTTDCPTSDYGLLVGLDWGDQEHALSFCVKGSQRIERATLAQTPEALAQWANALRSRCPKGKIAICLEQSRGALISGLLHYEHIVLFPINPKSAARFRQALYPSGSKNDPTDADLLLELILKHPDHLKPWRPDTPQTRQLDLLSEQRRGFVDLRTALTNQLLSHRKAIFPQALQLVGEDLASRLATDFLKKWPTLQALQKVKASTLRRFYYAHNSRSHELITRRLAVLKNAIALTQDSALLAAHSLAIETLVGQLQSLRASLKGYDQQVALLFEAHPDAELFKSLPGAGPALAPRLLCTLGSDRSRYPKALSLSCYTGIAPVTEKSGKSKWVHVRWACPKFARQSWHEFANSSRHFNPWAQACYERLKQRMDHHEAIRKLAYKWQRIVWRMWQDRKPYDENRYVQSLQGRGLETYADLTSTL